MCVVHHQLHIATILHGKEVVLSCKYLYVAAAHLLQVGAVLGAVAHERQIHGRVPPFRRLARM
jgi:hypothetical protein